MKKVSLLLTCEHASNRVPRALETLFRQQKRSLLSSHRAWDPGALPIARTLAKSLKAPLLEGQFSRLVIDLNRSPQHRGVFSELTRRLPLVERKRLLETLHAPFHDKARRHIHRGLAQRRYLCHFSIHSFTPMLNGEVRNCEIGILYDPRRPHEKRLAIALKAALQRQLPEIRLRMNYPYRGTSDGHTSQLRRSFPDAQYAGIELEFNQAWRKARSPAVQKTIATAIRESLKTYLEY